MMIKSIELENLTNREAVFDVEVADETGTRVFEVERAVAERSAVALKRPVDEPGRYAVGIETDGQALTQDISLFADPEDSCVIAVGRLDRAERLRIEGDGYRDCSDSGTEGRNP